VWGLVWHVALPFVLNVALAAVLLIAVPGVLSAPLSFLMYQIPDLGYTLAISGVVALVWGVTRTILAVLILRRSSPSIPMAVTAPANA
jgi:hypothetical protein